MTEKKPPAPIALDASFLTPMPVPSAPSATSSPSTDRDLGLNAGDLDDSDEGAAVPAASPPSVMVTPVPVTPVSATPPPPIRVTPVPVTPVSATPPPPVVVSPVTSAAGSLGLSAGDLDDSDEGAPIALESSTAANVVSSEGASEEKKKKKKSKIFSADGLEALDLDYIPEKFRKHLDPASPPPLRMAAARAMVPMGPKDMVHLVYQCMFDEDAKIGKMARASFKKLDDRILQTVLSDVSTAPPVLGLLAKTRIESESDLEALVLNRSTPDTAFSHLAEHATFHSIIGMVAGNQERAMRCHDIVRGLKKNPQALRSELDRTIDFMVREGVFLEDMQEFEDSFVRLGKNEMLAALKKVEVRASDLTEEQLRMAASIGVTPEEFLLGGSKLVDELEAKLKAEADAAAANRPPVPMGQKQAEEDEDEGSKRRKSLASYSVPLQVKMAMIGDHICALEALKSNNRMVASAGIRNPQIREADIPKIVYSKSMHDDVIRYICNNRDWIKGYAVKKGLIMNPKTPISLVLRWLPLLRPFDLKALAKSKQVPSAVSVNAKRLLANKSGG